MFYLIDGNNLAGSLKILEKKDFDLKLVQKLKELLSNTGKKATVVFDSNSFMGDKEQDGRLTVIYSPKDNYYTSADDKIVEIAEQEGSKQKVVLVSNDIGIKKRVEKLSNKSIVLEDSTRFAQKNFKNPVKKDGLSPEDKEELNQELLKRWGK